AMLLYKYSHLKKVIITANMLYFVYILRTASNTLYIGQTNNVIRRVKEHQGKNKKSSKNVRSFSSFQLVYTEIYDSLSKAMRRESKLKKLTKAKKEELIAAYLSP